ncbi:MAG: 4-(cytidine 5'-diphospho)-2-C-methyl-D-erythritol kinase [Chitinophagia bacterium]|jgi:4-diphosphocytidyl-2-C-methyl-D-erythritol kinase|nr:4-(cytidine 5'-diphospho)-2-C-methyl-D-erythritol kinase [Chitinophagia bacterium]NCA30196.1 4-(cytidine 5'-diphospho)-2-C-methyl-D-erythritol kinase [Chitinophagia bacterium]
MIQFSPCKINLGLSILAKRTDGFHALETVFYPVALHDIVEIVPEKLASKENSNTINGVSFTHTGIRIPGDAANNLCVKAYHLLKADYPHIGDVQIHLHKNIPMGAGLGGGSSDGTTVLKILNTLFNLNLSKEQLVHYAAILGSDCPFFVFDKACHASGRGEILEPISIDLSNYTIVLVHPGIHIATPWAFQQLNPCIKEKTIAEIIKQPIETWKAELINDFEVPVFKAHPALEDFKNNLYSQGAIYASMSGSGSSLFGIFSKGSKIKSPTAVTSIRVDHI